MTRLEIGGGQIEYHWDGAAGNPAPTLVFLHEGLGCARTWGRFPGALANAVNGRALVYSRFGYGGSSPLPHARSDRFMHVEALDVLPRVLDALAIRAPILVGQSDGASIALIHAASNPSAVAALILEAPHVFAEPATRAGVARIRARFEQDAEFRQKLARYHMDARGVVDDWTRAWTAPSFADWTIEADLPAITCPVLLLQAERDPYGTLTHVERIAAQVRGPVRTVVLPGHGHAPHRDKRARTLREMTAFIGSLVAV